MDKKLIVILQLFAERSALSLHDLAVLGNTGPAVLAEDVVYLHREGYLKVDGNYALLHDLKDGELTQDAPLVLTVAGRVALQNKLDAQKERRFNEIRAWITLAIAFAALVISIISVSR